MTVEEFLSQGGKITICPPRFAAPIQGAAQSGIVVSALSDEAPKGKTWRQEKARAAAVLAAKLRSGPTAAQLKARQSHAEKQKAQCLAAAAEAKAMLDRGETVENAARLMGRNLKNLRRLLREHGVIPKVVK